jgi:hypothetical protein
MKTIYKYQPSRTSSGAAAASITAPPTPPPLRKSEAVSKRRILKGFKPTTRDVSLFKTLYGLGVMSVSQIQKEFWPGRGGVFGPVKNCQRRLKLLTDHNYIRKIVPVGGVSERFAPCVYALDQLGAYTLEASEGLVIPASEWRGRRNEQSFFSTRHSLAIVDIFMRFRQSLSNLDVKIQSWVHEKFIKRNLTRSDYFSVVDPGTGQAIRATVVPDLAMWLQKGSQSDSLMFIEVDMGSEPVNRRQWRISSFIKKASLYIAQQANLPFFNSLPGTPLAPVLTISTSPARLQNMRAVARNLGGGNKFWFTTFDQVYNPRNNILTSPIWQTSADDNFYSLLGN